MEHDVVEELAHQHARIITMVSEVRGASDSERPAKLAELRAFQIMHEAAEQLVVRPVVGDDADAWAALMHGCDAEQRERMGRQLLAAEASLGDPVATLRAGADPLDQIVERTFRAIASLE